MSWRIPLADIDLGDEEISAATDVLKSKWLSMGAQTQAFEEAFAQRLHVKHAIAVANGTAALHLACLSIGLQPGDEAIVPALTFVATANAIRYTGATPVFADIVGEHDLNISADSIESRITDKTRAILVVHYGGYACDMPRIMAIAGQHNLAVIEDAAHAVTSELDGRCMGTWGDIGCFSFFSNKNLTTGEGGMMTTNDDALAAKLRLLRSHGMTSLSWERHKGHAFSYDVVELGFNYRIDEIRAAIGLVQLKKLDQNNAIRRQLSTFYWELLEELAPRVGLPFKSHPGVSAAHLLPILLPQGTDRKDFMEQMKMHGIQTSIHYPPIHKFTAFNGQSTEPQPHIPVTEEIALREVTLPLFPGLSEQDVQYVCETIQKIIH
jgi:dTDP-4-amino-4,6-dideoxygalactose transaminase